MGIIERISGGLGFKAAMIGALALVMMVPAALVGEVVRERSDRAGDVEREILESWGGELRVAGPILRIPCIRTEELTLKDERGAERKELREYTFDLWVCPVSLDIAADLATERKTRGIFSVPVFYGALALSGAFDAAEAVASLAPNEEALVDQAEIVLAVANQEGIRGLKEASWDGRPMEMKPGDSGFGLLSGGMHASAAHVPGEPAPFRIELEAQGGGGVWFVPLGQDSSVALSSDWPSPSFRGNYLPSRQRLDAEGFSAGWKVSYLSHGIPLFWTEGGPAPLDRVARSFFGADFLEVLDRYALAGRSVKYALLFIVVPFMTLFMLEIFARKRIHPVQYLLAGLANMVFYLLLLSISEHASFNLAYVVSAGAVCLLVVAYSRSVFGSLRKAWHIGPAMALSYLYLFITLRSEDWALLIGSVGAFAAVGVLMFVTRKVDWYGAGRSRDADGGSGD